MYYLLLSTSLVLKSVPISNMQLQIKLFLLQVYLFRSDLLENSYCNIVFSLQMPLQTQN